MMKSPSRLLAATTMLAASAVLTSSLAGEAPAAAPAAPAPALIAQSTPSAPPKEYVIPKKGVSDAIRKAVENPNRRKEDVVRDGYRRPAEVLALTGIKAGHKVIEFGSFGELDTYGQYYTTLLSDIVGPKGMVYMFDAKQYDEQLGVNSRAFAAARPNVKYEAVDFNAVSFPRGIDIAISNLFHHQLLSLGVELTPFHDKLFKAMKPGGIYLVIDHAGEIGQDIKKTLPLGRVDPSVVRSDLQAGGFQFVLEDRLLERTDDDHKWPIHTDGKRDQTDQMVYVFRKPVVY